MKNHVKQMLRTPMQSLLIIVLIMIVTVMLVAGGNLWVTSDRLSKAYENDFITMGTVTQKPDTVVERKEWDAGKKDYQIYRQSVYNRYVTVEDLDFPEVDYIVEPEHRAYWGSYAPEYLHYQEARGGISYSWLIAEFSPLEDGVPCESMLIDVKKILGSDKMMEGTRLWFCDHYNRYPEELKADRTYVAMISERSNPHGKKWEESGSSALNEYEPVSVDATLYAPDGRRIEDPISVKGIYEVTEGFYDTPMGQRFLATADTAGVVIETQPVVGTNSTDILMPFYEGSAWVYEGRYPTQEEYAQGSRVCLAPREFAENNGLSVGDQITTRLYYTNVRNGVEYEFTIYGYGLGFQFIGLDGKLLEPFEEAEYTIVGLYDYTPMTSEIGTDELIVPLNSVHKKTENILEFGAMADDNTSFRIENGSIADFLEASTKHGVDNMIYTFYDRGYSALVEGIRNMKNMSAALLIMGLIAAVILTLQISYIYITKQKSRLSIERLLGMTGKRCRNISLAGVFILLLLGTVPGVAAGNVLAGSISIEDMERGNFDRTFSNMGLKEEPEAESSEHERGNLAVSCAMGFLVIMLGVGLSGVRVRKVLRGEPLYLLESQEKM